MNINRVQVPPRELQLWAGGSEDDSYLHIGEELAEQIIKATNARESMKILEPGCGAGRVSRFFLDFLDEEAGGEFVGFDVHYPSIDWASSNIACHAENFRFHALDVYSDMYNPGFNNPHSSVSDENWQDNVDVWESADPGLGSERKILSSEIRFPYTDNYFDLTYSTSLFTHLMKPYLEKCIQEIFRVSCVGAKVFSTFFRIGKGGIDEFVALCVERKLPDRYEQFDDVSYTLIKTMSSAMMIFKQQYLESVITTAGFRIVSSGSGFQGPWVIEKIAKT